MYVIKKKYKDISYFYLCECVRTDGKTEQRILEKFKNELPAKYKKYYLPNVDAANLDCLNTIYHGDSFELIEQFKKQSFKVNLILSDPPYNIAKASKLTIKGNDIVNNYLEEFHIRMGQRLINAYELPAGAGRYDTTSFNVYHNVENRGKGVLNFGHSKDKRPVLLQYKQGLAVLDPAGIPILSGTLCGNTADDPCCLPARRRMVKTIGSPEFLFTADCKAASSETRAAIDCEKGYYLFPLTMTGGTPREIEELAANQPELLEVIEVPDGADSGLRAGVSLRKRKYHVV